MNQVSFLSFALIAQTSSPGGVNLNPVGGPSGAGGLPVCTTKKRRKPLPPDQLPLPLVGASSAFGQHLQFYKQLHSRYLPSSNSPIKRRCEAKLLYAAAKLIGAGL